MPATAAEMGQWVRDVLDGRCMPDTEPIWADGTRASEQERREFCTLVQYEARYRRRQALDRVPKRRAAQLLKQFLTPEQQQEWRLRGNFRVTAPSGRVYRFQPNTGACCRVTYHGTRWFVHTSFCLHPSDSVEPIPPADVTLAQLLLLSADEEEFLRRANATLRRDQLWNPRWRRRCAARRAEERVRQLVEAHFQTTGLWPEDEDEFWGIVLQLIEEGERPGVPIAERIASLLPPPRLQEAA